MFSHFGDIRNMPDSFYQEFSVVVAGLDSITARRWINATLVSYVDTDSDGNWDISTAIPLVDGGTEAFKGQTRVVIPRFSSCLECSLDLFPADPLNFQMCTLAERPRQPEHCIEYILRKWDEYSEWEGTKLDKDNAEHMAWIYKMALERAKEFNIEGVTLKLTQGVVKRIIPAIASTNAIISAACVNEVFKIATSSGTYLDNYMAYNGTEGVYTNTFKFMENPQCSVCGTERAVLKISRVKTLQDLMEELIESPKFQLNSPSISTIDNEGSRKNLYVRGLLEKSTRLNLEKTLDNLIESGDTLYVTDPSLTSSIGIEIEVELLD